VKYRNGFRLLAEDLLQELGVKITPNKMVIVLQFIKDSISYAVGDRSKRTLLREEEKGGDKW